MAYFCFLAVLRIGINKLVSFLQPIVENGLRSVMLFGMCATKVSLVFCVVRIVRLNAFVLHLYFAVASVGHFGCSLYHLPVKLQVIRDLHASPKMSNACSKQNAANFRFI